MLLSLSISKCITSKLMPMIVKLDLLQKIVQIPSVMFLQNTLYILEVTSLEMYLQALPKILMHHLIQEVLKKLRLLDNYFMIRLSYQIQIEQPFMRTLWEYKVFQRMKSMFQPKEVAGLDSDHIQKQIIKQSQVTLCGKCRKLTLLMRIFVNSTCHWKHLPILSLAQFILK